MSICIVLGTIGVGALTALIYCAYNISKLRLKIRPLHTDVMIPEPAHDGDAGLDLYLYDDEITVPSRGRTTAHTGLSIEIPRGYYGKVASRSGNSFKHGIEIGAGVISASGYRGELHVLIYNHSDVDVIFKKNDVIAQLIIHKIMPPTAVNIKNVSM